MVRRKRRDSMDALYNVKKDLIPPPPKQPKSRPKRAQTAWIFYTKEQRPIIKADKPETKFGEYLKIMAKDWADMSARNKKKYEDLAAEAKEEQDEKRQKYLKSRVYKQYKRRKAEWTDIYGEEYEEQQRDKAEKREKAKAKRAKNKGKNAKKSKGKKSKRKS